MRSERALDGEPVHLPRPGPALRRPQHDRGPARSPRDARPAGLGLDGPDALVTPIEHRRELLVHRRRVVALDEVHGVAVTLDGRSHVVVGRAREHRRPADFVAVEVEDWQHGTVTCGVQVAHALPRSRQRPGLRLAVTDHRGDDQVRVVERRSEGVGEHITQLAAFVDRPRRRDADVAGHATGRRELAEQATEAVAGLGDLRIDLGVRAFEVDVRDDRRPAVTGAGEEDHVDVLFCDQSIEVHVHEAETGRRAPMAEQSRLDVLRLQRDLEKRVVEEVDLSGGQVIGGLPVPMHPAEQRCREGPFRRRLTPARDGSPGLHRARDRRVELIHGRVPIGAVIRSADRYGQRRFVQS